MHSQKRQMHARRVTRRAPSRAALVKDSEKARRIKGVIHVPELVFANIPVPRVLERDTRGIFASAPTAKLQGR